MRVFLFVTLTAVFVSGCIGDLKGEERELERAEEQLEEARRDEAGFAESLGRVMEDVGRALQDEPGVSVVHAETLRDLLPERLLGMDRYNSDTDQSGKWGIRVSHAKARYRRGDNRVSLAVVDMGTLRGALSNSTEILNSATSHRGPDGFTKTTRIKGYPAHVRFEQGSRENELDGVLIVAERFLVVLDARGDFTEDLFDEAFEQVNLRRLERLAAE